MIAALNEKYGSSVEAPNSNKLSLIICDTSEVWIMDIVGKLWAAEHVKGTTGITNLAFTYNNN